MSQPKPAAIFDRCQHCGVITVWQYRVDNQDAGAEGRDYQCQDCQCCGQSADEIAERLAQAVATVTVMNRTRRSIVEMDMRLAIGRIRIDSWCPCSLLGVDVPAALGMSGDANAGQVRGQLVAADVAVFQQLRKWGPFCRW